MPAAEHEMSPRIDSPRGSTGSPARATRPRARLRRRLGRLALRLAGGVVLLCLAAAFACVGCLAALPGVSGAPTLAARIELRHHEPLGTQVPNRLAHAVVASEDAQFGDEVVVNVLSGAARAAGAWIGGQPNPGGATIDQQLAKALYDHRSGPTATLRQIGLGIKLGLGYSRRQILGMYLNVNYFGNGFWGVSEAAEGYFGVRPSQLNWAEASLLAGLLQAPSAYDPLRHHEAAKARQRYVLQRLVADGVLSPARAHRAFRRPLPLRVATRA
jgi:membrane peptidoglycan carboxypeptidase